MAKKFTKLNLGDIVKTIGSKSFRKLTTIVPETEDELAGTWVFNDSIVSQGSVYFVDFTYNGVACSRMSGVDNPTSTDIPVHTGGYLWYYVESSGYVNVYKNGWISEDYKTITITSKLAEVENGDTLLTWLKANATKQTTTAPTLITFTIDGVEYQAEDGMTWEQWCASEYNTNSRYSVFSDNQIIQDGVGTQIVSIEGWGLDVFNTDTIIADTAYQIYYACFVAGTPVLMADGTTKPIETVVTGDEVITYNEETGEYRTGIVVNPYILRYSGVMAKITLEDGSYIEMTENHPLYTEDGWKSLNRYKDLPELTTADKVRSLNGNYLAISSIEKWVETNVITTYSLNVEEDDNFFVGTTPVMAQNIDYIED